MKAIKKTLLGFTVALTAVGLFLPVAANADGKGAALKQLKLMYPGTSGPAAAVAVSAPATMACPKCTDARGTVAEASFKAVNSSVKYYVTTHQCSACNDRLTKSGTGKTAIAKSIHVCQMESVASNCCAMQ